MKESVLQSWIDEHLSELYQKTRGLDEIINAPDVVPPALTENAWLDTMTAFNWACNHVLEDRFKDALSIFSNGGELHSLGKEFPLVESELPGRKPSADILAVFDEMAAYAIIEVKTSHATARECITELSAYANGLGNRYIGLSSHDCIWVLISTEYRPTVIDALVHQIIFAGRRILPLLARPSLNADGDIIDVEYEVQDIRGKIDRITTDSLLSSDAWCMLEHYTQQDVGARSVIQHIVSQDFHSCGCSGFSFFKKHCGAFDREMQMPFGLIVCIQNPFASYLKRRQMEYFQEQGIEPDSDDYRKIFTSSARDFIYVSLQKGWPLSEVERDEDGRPTYPDGDDDYYKNSLAELSQRTLNSGYSSFKKIIARIAGANPGQIAIGEPDFHGALLNETGINPTHYNELNMEELHHFGFFHEAMLRLSQSKLFPEFTGSPIARYSAPAFLLRLLRAANQSGREV